MQFSTDLGKFLVELWQRMSLKSPKFFQVVQGIGMAAALITGIPLAIQQFSMITGVEIALPDVVNFWVIRVIFWCGVVTKIIGKLPVTSTDRPVTSDGKVEAKTEVLPYTAKVDEKK